MNGSDFEQRLEAVRGRIARACERAGRPPAEVSLLAITKGVAPESIVEAERAGLRVFGESRVQEAKQKIPLCAEGIEWHMVGHLQTNKVKDAARLFRAIHSVDSARLLEALNSACLAAGTRVSVMIEVNVSGEGAKYGMKPDEVGGLLAASCGMAAVKVTGLMTVPPFAEDPEGARPFFRMLRDLRDRLKGAGGWELNDLSMGMSRDFETAIEEGATWVRLGTGLFGKRDGGA